MKGSVYSTWSFQFSRSASFESTIYHLPTRASGQPDCLLKSDRPHSPFRSHTFSNSRASPPNCEHSVLLVSSQLLSGKAEVYYGDKEAGELSALLIHDSADISHVQLEVI